MSVSVIAKVTLTIETENSAATSRTTKVRRKKSSASSVQPRKQARKVFRWSRFSDRKIRIASTAAILKPRPRGRYCRSGRRPASVMRSGRKHLAPDRVRHRVHAERLDPLDRLETLTHLRIMMRQFVPCRTDSAVVNCPFAMHADSHPPTRSAHAPAHRPARRRDGNDGPAIQTLRRPITAARASRIAPAKHLKGEHRACSS